jgi:solute:Na+ symporter, SSS family
LFATFIIGMFWKRMTPWAGFWGLLSGTAAAVAAYYANKGGLVNLGSDQASAFWGAFIAFVVDGIVSVGVSLFTQPKPVEELQGLVHGMANEEEHRRRSESVWYRKPSTLAAGALGITAILSFVFA